MGEVEMIECPNHGGAFDCTPFCPRCAGEQEVVRDGSALEPVEDAETGWLLLIEQPPRNMESIARLWDWSRNFTYPSPATVFLFLIAWEDLGEPSLSDELMLKVMGYVELDLLADALKTYADQPREVEDYVANLLRAEAEL